MRATVDVTYASGVTPAHGTFVVPGLEVNARELAALRADATVVAIVCVTCREVMAPGDCPMGI